MSEKFPSCLFAVPSAIGKAKGHLLQASLQYGQVLTCGARPIVKRVQQVFSGWQVVFRARKSGVRSLLNIKGTYIWPDFEKAKKLVSEVCPCSSLCHLTPPHGPHVARAAPAPPHGRALHAHPGSCAALCEEGRPSDQRSISRRRGSSSASFTRTRKVTAPLPSTMR